MCIALLGYLERDQGRNSKYGHIAPTVSRLASMLVGSGTINWPWWLSNWPQTKIWAEWPSQQAENKKASVIKKLSVLAIVETRQELS